MAEATLRPPRGFYKRGSTWWVHRGFNGHRIRVSTKTEILAEAIAWAESQPRLCRQPRQRPRISSPFNATPFRFTDSWIGAALRRTARKLAERRFTLDDFRAIIARADGRCEVTGIPFCDHKLDGIKRGPFYPSLDRIDWREPYSVANCRLVCLCVNLAMNQWGDDVFDMVCLGRCTTRLANLGHAARPQRKGSLQKFPYETGG